ncbi:MAG: cell division protein ZapA [Dysgonamonadaceae bacterium]|jgi:cell division protein ZapA|nr:cell division protein ZapA [Dysgonamonadaceae bacterium]
MEEEYFPNPIQLKIVDKHFPYSCKRKEEQTLRKAATNVTDKYMAYSSYYSGSGFPMVDLLKLVAFHFSLELQEDKQREDMTPFIDKIEQLNAELEQYVQAF